MFAAMLTIALVMMALATVVGLSEHEVHRPVQFVSSVPMILMVGLALEGILAVVGFFVGRW